MHVLQQNKCKLRIVKLFLKNLYRCTVHLDIKVSHSQTDALTNVLEGTKIYIKIHNKMLLHVSVCDHHQGACT